MIFETLKTSTKSLLAVLLLTVGSIINILQFSSVNEGGATGMRYTNTAQLIY